MLPLPATGRKSGLLCTRLRGILQFLQPLNELHALTLQFFLLLESLFQLTG